MKNHLKLYLKSNAYLLILLLITIVFRTEFKPIPSDLALQVSTDISVISQKPAWIAYQNRLLGPYTYGLLQLFGLSNEKAGMLFNSVWIITTVTLFNHFLNMSFKLNSIARIGFTSLYLFLYLFLKNNTECFYSWDLYDSLFFTIFSYFVIQKKSLKHFISLFFLSLLNRESALFIAASIILRAFPLNKDFFNIKKVDIKTLAMGFLLFFFEIFLYSFHPPFLIPRHRPRP